MIFDMLSCVSSEYIDDLMQEVLELCTKPIADRPEPLWESPTLTSGMERPDKTQTVDKHRSSFKAKDHAL